MKLQLARMHKEFGRDYINKCGDCCNLSSYSQGRKWYKCDRYGDSRSTATDWALSWPACGKFNIPLGKERPLIEYVKMCIDQNLELEGQMSL